MIKLTKDNYYTPENTALSTTKVKDFIKSKEMYYRRYVECTEPSLNSPSIVIGRIIDKCLEQMGLHNFYRTYRRSVLKKDNPEEYAIQKAMEPERVLTGSMYDTVVAIVDKAIRSPFLKFYQDRKNKSSKQVILQAKYEDIDICGMLDRLTINKDTAYIDDYKVTGSSSVRSAKSWGYMCLRAGYFMQLAVYSWLLKETDPLIQNVVCRHVVFSSSKFDLYPIKLFIIPNKLLVEPLQLFFETAKQIVKEEDYKDKLPSWEEAEFIPEDLIEPIMEEIDLEDMDKL